MKGGEGVKGVAKSESEYDSNGVLNGAGRTKSKLPYLNANLCMRWGFRFSLPSIVSINPLKTFPQMGL
jgi:hypothetical protein